MGTILSFDKLVAGIQKRASVKNADSTVPEKDERESSTSIPKDPDGATKKTVGLENDTNADTTKSFTVTPAKTVVGEEKPASALAQQAQKVAAGILLAPAGRGLPVPRNGMRQFRCLEHPGSGAELRGRTVLLADMVVRPGLARRPGGKRRRGRALCLLPPAAPAPAYAGTGGGRTEGPRPHCQGPP